MNNNLYVVIVFLLGMIMGFLIPAETQKYSGETVQQNIVEHSSSDNVDPIWRAVAIVFIWCYFSVVFGLYWTALNKKGTKVKTQEDNHDTRNNTGGFTNTFDSIRESGNWRTKGT